MEDWDPVATDAQRRSQHFRELMTPAVLQEAETQIKCFRVMDLLLYVV